MDKETSDWIDMFEKRRELLNKAFVWGFYTFAAVVIALVASMVLTRL